MREPLLFCQQVFEKVSEVTLICTDFNDSPITLYSIKKSFLFPVLCPSCCPQKRIPTRKLAKIVFYKIFEIQNMIMKGADLFA